MNDSPFDKYPPGFRPLLDRLSPPDEQGIVTLQEPDRDTIVLAVLKLGEKLRHIQHFVDKARKAEIRKPADLDPVRNGVGSALIEIREALLPIYGADLTWPLTMTIEILDCAVQGKRHPLTTLPGEDLHTLTNARTRLVLQAFASAALDFFYERLPNPSQDQIGKQIAEAMGKGGFHVKRYRIKKPVSGRTVQDWRNLHLPGQRNRTASSEAKAAFTKLRKNMEVQQGSTPIVQYFDRVLSDITASSRMVL
jgi:hypothetical protein